MLRRIRRANSNQESLIANHQRINHQQSQINTSERHPHIEPNQPRIQDALRLQQTRPVLSVDLRDRVAVERVEEVELRPYQHLSVAEITRHGKVDLIDAVEKHRARLV